uniref:Uncharacterized protein n=1 Tax=Panagrolaimus sp. PS1159 TaxID=55785 RepID=A0AC35GTM8_9BILA
MAFVFDEKRFLRIQKEKAIQRRSAYEALEREFAEIRAEALPILDLLQVLDLEDLRYEFLRLKFQQLEKRAAQIAKLKRKAREAEIDEYTDDDEDRTPAFFIKEPGSPARDQGNSGFASRGGGGGRGGGIASRGGGFASCGG